MSTDTTIDARHLDLPAPHVTERAANDRSGWGMLGVGLGLLLAGIIAIVFVLVAADTTRPVPS